MLTGPKRTLSHLDPNYRARLRERLESKVAITEDGCHLFVGASDGRGYGKIAVDGTTAKTHVISYLLNRGDIDGKLDVCHSCNVKNCVNPSHLYLGTRSENTQHAVRDGLQKCRLTDEQVVEIYRRWHEEEIFQHELAKEYGVDQPIVNRILKGLAFKWVPRPKLKG